MTHLDSFIVNTDDCSSRELVFVCYRVIPSSSSDGKKNDSRIYARRQEAIYFSITQLKMHISFLQ